MAQNRSSEQPTANTATGSGDSRLIEKGWTVNDAVERPIGNVTDVDTARGVLLVDGRPAGYTTFEIPLDLVASAGGNEVRLTRVLDPNTPSGGAPTLIDAPPTPSAASTGRSRSRPRTETTTSRTTAPASTTTASTTGAARSTTSSPAPAPLDSDSFKEFKPPYATAGATPEHARSAPRWEHRDESHGWGTKKLALAGLTVGGLSAAAYLIQRRTRRKTRYERFMDTASGLLDVTTTFARDRHPAWWASLVAAALPAAYYAWPSPAPTRREQAHNQIDSMAGTIGEYFGSLASMMPAMPTSDILPARMRQRLPDDLSMRSDVMWPAGLLAAGILAFYLARRRSYSRPSGGRIADVMTRQPRVIQPDATVADAAAMMRRLDVGALPVCDGSRLIGMLTDRDITVRATADGRDPHLTPVRDVMSPGIAWASEDDPIEEAARIMREHQIRRLPIVDERHSLVGVVSLGDLAVDVSDSDLSGDTLERISEPSRPTR